MQEKIRRIQKSRKKRKKHLYFYFINSALHFSLFSFSLFKYKFCVFIILMAQACSMLLSLVGHQISQ